MYKYCLRCGKPIKKLEYRQRGYGKCCWDKIQISNVEPLFEPKVNSKNILKKFSKSIDNSCVMR